MYRINVLIVTYKQADVIGRNIESILQQKEYGLNKIIICDDCSPDNNWEVIQTYVNKYPDCIEAYRNDSNLGIYGNSNKLMSLRGNADLYCWLEGDDALCAGFFEKAQSFISSNRLDLSKAVGLFSGFKSINPNGQVFISANDYIKKHPRRNLYGAYSRGFVSWRSGLFSSEVLNRFTPVITSQGLSLAESSFDSQWFLHSDVAYYMPFISSIYYSGIGVSTFIYDGEYDKSEALIQYEYYLKNNVTSFFDYMWGKSNIIRVKYWMNVNWSFLKKVYMIIIYIICFIIGSIPYGINWAFFKSCLSRLLKRL